jgi:hypothetical protein
MNNTSNIDQLCNDIKIKLSSFLNIQNQENSDLEISIDQPLDDFMSSISISEFLEQIRQIYNVELCWGRIVHNPTIMGIVELIQDETENGYSCG